MKTTRFAQESAAQAAAERMTLQSNNTTNRKVSMKINTTLELTKQELLDRITEAVNKEHRWGTRYDLSNGVALDCTMTLDGGFKVVWGEKPEPETETTKAPKIAAAPMPVLMES